MEELPVRPDLARHSRPVRLLPLLSVALMLAGCQPGVPGPLRRAALAGGGGVVHIDDVLRRWPVAGLSLLLLTILFGAAMAAGGRP